MGGHQILLPAVGHAESRQGLGWDSTEGEEDSTKTLGSLKYDVYMMNEIWCIYIYEILYIYIWNIVYI